MATEHPDGDIKSRLLAAAMTEFAANGIAGARVDAIAKRAGANIQMLYYYFDSKEELFRQTLRRYVAMSVDLLREWQWLEPDHLKFMESEEGLSVYYESAPATSIRLTMWEALEHGEDRPLEEEDPRYAMHQQWIERIRQQQKLGQLAPELDPAQLLLLELALIIFPLAFPQLARFATGMSPTDPEFVAARIQFLRDLAPRLSASTDTNTKQRGSQKRR